MKLVQGKGSSKTTVGLGEAAITVKSCRRRDTVIRYEDVRSVDLSKQSKLNGATRFFCRVTANNGDSFLLSNVCLRDGSSSRDLSYMRALKKLHAKLGAHGSRVRFTHGATTTWNPVPVLSSAIATALSCVGLASLAKALGRQAYLVGRVPAAMLPCQSAGLQLYRNVIRRRSLRQTV